MTYLNYTIVTKEEDGKWIFEIPELNMRQDSKPMTGGIMTSEVEAESVAKSYIDYKIEIDAINERVSAEMISIETIYKENVSN